jgi:pilus assembly protein Flp/PilA
MHHIVGPSQQAHPRASHRFETSRRVLAAFAADESGQDLIEYALVAALIGLGAVLSMKGLSGKVGNAFNSVGNSLTNNV